MEWASPLESAAGPLLRVAHRFVTEHPGAPSAREPGVTALSELAASIDAWASHEEVDPNLDEAFVEGAGALLALVLLQHLGGAHIQRGEAHRIRVGQDGFADPFAAIEAALEGPDARPVLVQEIRRAEAEASGQAGVGRAMRHLRAELAETRPELSIEDHFGAHVRLSGDIELDLSRVIRATEDSSEGGARTAMRKLVGMLPGSANAAPETFDALAERILPRPVSAGFAERLASEGRGTLACRSWMGGALELALIADFEDRARYLRASEIERWQMSFDDVLRAALANLARRSTTARFARIDTNAGPLVVARSGDGLDGARLLLPTLHQVLAPDLGPTIRVAIPHRDALWACPAETAVTESLSRRVREDAQRAPHRISDALFYLDARGLRVA